MNRAQASGVTRYTRRRDPFWVGVFWGGALGLIAGILGTTAVWFRVLS